MINDMIKDLRDLEETDLRMLNNAVLNELKRIRAAKSKAVKMTLNEGDQVMWSGRKGMQRGTVVSIKRKYAHVDVGTGTWRVPMNMLKRV
jgi:hypothetical protein